MKKTTQAIKISASFTPDPDTAARMVAAAFPNGGAKGVRFEGGRIGVRHAIAIDMRDPHQAARVAARVKQIEESLDTHGVVHSFVTQAGAAPIDAVETLPSETDAKAAE